MHDFQDLWFPDWVIVISPAQWSVVTYVVYWWKNKLKTWKTLLLNVALFIVLKNILLILGHYLINPFITFRFAMEEYEENFNTSISFLYTGTVCFHIWVKCEYFSKPTERKTEKRNCGHSPINYNVYFG